MDGDPRIGAQRAVLPHLSLADSLADFESVGLDCVDLLDAHVAPDDGDEAVEAVVDTLARSSLSLAGYGVVEVAQVEAIEPYAALAARLDAEYFVVNYPPDRDDLTGRLLSLAHRHDLDVALHNYSAVHHDDLEMVFSSIADVAGVLDRFDDPRLGACLDTGHLLVADESPERAVDRLAGRLHAVHLKDTSETDVEDVPGAGRLDLDAVLGALAEYDALDAPLIVEYELPPERASAGLREAVANVRGALDRLA